MVTYATDRNSSSVNSAEPFRTIVHRTKLEPADGRPNMDYFRSILSKFEAFVRTF